ncbi:MAG: ATP-binding cassette domain-containing protein [Terracidiphilus sp.]
MIPRIYEAPQGTLFIDGRPIDEYPLAVLRRNIGMVPQETFLFSETIRENLAFGAPNASPEDLLEAADAAHIRCEFEEFPQGFETMVGERGVTLSGGQKQRSAIARALLRRPAILILDDALASVDTYTEERILGRVAQLHGDGNNDLDFAQSVNGAQRRPHRGAGQGTNCRSRTARRTARPSTATTPAFTRSSNWKKS